MGSLSIALGENSASAFLYTYFEGEVYSCSRLIKNFEREVLLHLIWLQNMHPCIHIFLEIHVTSDKHWTSAFEGSHHL